MKKLTTYIIEKLKLKGFGEDGIKYVKLHLKYYDVHNLIPTIDYIWGKRNHSIEFEYTVDNAVNTGLFTYETDDDLIKIYCIIDLAFGPYWDDYDASNDSNAIYYILDEDLVKNYAKYEAKVNKEIYKVNDIWLDAWDKIFKK